MQNRFLRLPQVIDRVGVSRSWIYQRMAEGEFPRSVAIGERAVGWIEGEVQDWIKARIAVCPRKELAHAANTHPQGRPKGGRS